MTDKELLELAAKAAGIEPEWREWRTGRIAEFQVIKYTKREGFWLNNEQWNPLANDGDALRLAVDLDLRIKIQSDPVGLTEICLPNTGWYSAPEYHNGDRYAATRRAIVRAAAKIGERMK